MSVTKLPRYRLCGLSNCVVCVLLFPGNRGRAIVAVGCTVLL